MICIFYFSISHNFDNLSNLRIYTVRFRYWELEYLLKITNWYRVEKYIVVIISTQYYIFKVCIHICVSVAGIFIPPNFILVGRNNRLK